MDYLKIACTNKLHKLFAMFYIMYNEIALRNDSVDPRHILMRSSSFSHKRLIT
jgi:hypothetical protein